MKIIMAFRDTHNTTNNRRGFFGYANNPSDFDNIGSELDGLVEKMRSVDLLFQRACRQIVLLNNKIEDLNVRYRRCRRERKPACRYSVRIQLGTVEGMRNMFYEYASRRADELESLQEQLIASGFVGSGEAEPDEDEEDMDSTESVESHPVVSS